MRGLTWIPLAFSLVASGCSTNANVATIGKTSEADLRMAHKGIVIVSAERGCAGGIGFYAKRDQGGGQAIKFGISQFGIPEPPVAIELDAGTYSTAKVSCHIKGFAGYQPPVEGPPALTFTVNEGEIADIGRLMWISHLDSNVPRLSGSYLAVRPHSRDDLKAVLALSGSEASRVQTRPMQIANPMSEDLKKWICDAQRKQNASQILGSIAKNPPICELVAPTAQ